MTTPFPRTHTFSGFNAPIRMEGELFDLEVVEGEVPPALDGTWYRCGADFYFPPLHGDDVFVNGDGVVSAFEFSGGHVDFRTRFVRTEKFLLERAARRALFGAYRNPFSDDPSVAGKNRGTANTNVVWHGGKLLALKESARPVQIDPITLDTIGEWDFGGRLTSVTMTAHPKLDPITGEMLFYGSAAKGETTPDIAFYVADRDGRITKEVWLDPPYASMMHDFGVTRDHVVFLVMPTTSSLERMRAGGPIYVWDDELETHIGVMARDGDGSDLRWFTGPPRFVFHILNCFSAGNTVHIDSAVSQIQSFPFFPDKAGKPFDPEKAKATITRWSCDLASNSDTFEEHQLNPLGCELIRIDDRVALGEYSYGFIPFHDAGARKAGDANAGFNSLGRLNVRTGEMEASFFAGPNASIQEPQFVARHAQAAEGDGYLLVIINRLDENRCDLVVLDAVTLSDGPLARIKLPIRTRAIHGNWVPRSSPTGA